MKKRFANKTNVLLVNITRLGDMLQATPTIAGIKEENPNARITVLVEKQFDEICRIIPGVDDVVSLDLSMTVRCLAREHEGIVDAYEYLSEVVEDLRSRKFDYCLNMSSSGYTALLLKLIGIDRNGGWTADEEGNRVIESEWAKLFASSVFHQNREFNSLNLVDVFRCSADVDKHPRHLIINVDDESLEFIDGLLAEAEFTNTGPLVAVQAGASQGKRQWSPARFVKLINVLINENNCRIVLTGSKKELPIIEAIAKGCNSPNVFIAAGKTNVPRLGALLKRSDILVTGDTGPMHMSVAVGTPVVSMFLASAYGFETGPYSEDNLVLQPVIACGPCNPNKPCARPDCHDQLHPKAIASLVMLRLAGPVRSVPKELFDPASVIVYRSFFDQFGFCDLEAINSDTHDDYRRYRAAYRKLWLDDLGGFEVSQGAAAQAQRAALSVVSDGLSHLGRVADYANEGRSLINRLIELIKDERAPGAALGEVNERLSELDRTIESVGFDSAPLGPITRMFMFAKENISGSGALELASQMGGVYDDLKRRSEKLAYYYQTVQ